MSEREIKNAVIESARLRICDHTGCLTANITFSYGDSGQGFGGFALYLPPDFKHHRLLSHCGHFVYRMLQVAEVDDWSNLVGRTVRVDASWHQVHRVGHIVKDDWFDPEADFKAVSS